MERWDDDNIKVQNCFARLGHSTSCPSYPIAGMTELYEQLLPMPVYYGKNTLSGPSNDMSYRLCNGTLTLKRSPMCLLGALPWLRVSILET